MKKNQVQSFDGLCKSLGLSWNGDDAVENMRKALTTTNSGPITVPRTSPLMLENMDGLMTEVLLTDQHFKLFNMIPRVPSAGLYHEWNRHTSFGTRRGSLGFAEGGGPKGGISAFERHGAYNRFTGVRGGITHQMLIAGSNGGTVEDPEVRENHDRAMELFEGLERHLVFGNSLVLDSSGTTVNPDGLLKLLTAGYAANVIDKEGAPLTFADFDNAALNLVKVGKKISIDGYLATMSPDVQKGLNDQYKDANVIRQLKDGANASFVPGFKVPSYETQFGTFEFENSLLLEEVPDSTPLAAADASAPATPGTITATPASSTTSKLPAGTFYYSVAAVNDYGESLCAVSGAATPEEGQKVTVSFTAVSGATAYRIYRGTVSNGSDAKWIAKIPAAANPSWDDVNAWRTVDSDGNPANGLCLVIKPDPKDVAVAQFMPLIKMPLPQSETTFPFFLLLYWQLIVKAGERMMIFKNCGAYTSQS
jgi:hypothetical protein